MSRSGVGGNIENNSSPDGQISLWHEGLPVDSLPAQGWLECPTADPSD
jgi:hypothetical protein